MPKTKKGKAAPSFSHHDVLSLIKDASVSQIQNVIGLLGEVKDARSRLENIFAGGVKAAQAYAPSLGTTSPKRRGKAGKVSQRVSKKGKTLPEPRTGSLRDLIHAVLKEKGPIKSGDIVINLKTKLGKKAGVSLGTQVSQVLSNRRDTKIKKVDRGVYTYQG